MSAFQFLGSDKPLHEMANSKVEFLSINEAIERNIELDDFILNTTKLNRDEKSIMFCASEEDLDELEIKQDMYYSHEYAKEYSGKQHFSQLHWRYTEARAKQLVDYIIDQLRNVDEIEIWSIWLDDREQASIKEINIGELTIKDLAFLDISKGFKKPEGLVVVK